MRRFPTCVVPKEKFCVPSALLIVLAFFVVPVSASENKSNMLFLLGEGMNKDALQNVSLDVSIASELNLKILGSGDSMPPETNFSDYEVIFIDSWSENPA